MTLSLLLASEDGWIRTARSVTQIWAQIVEDEDLGVGMPMALRAAAGDDAGVHDRGDEAVVLAGQDAELAAVAHDRTVSELELGIRYVAGLSWLGHVSPPEQVGQACAEG